MITKSDLNIKMEQVLLNPRFVELWWDLELPGLGKATPNQVFDRDPEKLAEYVEILHDLSSV